MNLFVFSMTPWELKERPNSFNFKKKILKITVLSNMFESILQIYTDI